ncbi:molybdopterin-dependent oxidoreductase [Proteinivorax hydrogeniformans]|uniref:Molybdopterin-dependent oxidoreductase n=1 Tax=Proteinivorax hydrogeniformans TaxID=1826727 RepID=A0AAU8HTN4_9FIRM
MSDREKFKINRRDFLKTSIGAGLAAGVGLSVPKFVKAKEQDRLPLNEEEAKVVPSFCGVCSGNCAIKAYVKNGRVVHLKGNPDDLAAQGRLCVKAYNSIETLYDPDRLKQPLKRTNPEKGIGVDPKFVEISWEEAIETIANKFNEIKEEYGGHAISFMHRSNPFSQRLGRAIGTPNFIAHQSTCFTTQEAAWHAMVTGSGKPWTYDLKNSKYILCFGTDLLGKAKNMHMQHVTDAMRKGAKLVVLDPYKSITAGKAHEWIPIKPGTDLAFTLAMIHVIIKEELYDKEFVEKYTKGFEEVKEFSKQYTPQWAEGKTEVPADVIVRIAREFAQTPPAHIPSHKRDAAGPNYVNSTKLAQTQVILNALVGTIDRPGGSLLPRNPSMPGFDAIFPPPEFPDMVTKRIDGWEEEPLMHTYYRGNMATVADGILNEDPYPVKAALVRGYNTLTFPNAKRMTKAFAEMDFLVTLEILPSELAQLSDIVLPEPHWLEGSGFADRAYNSMYPQLALKLPVHDSLYNTKGWGTITMEIAEKMGLGKYFEGVSGGKFNDERLKALGTSWEEFSKSPNGLWGDEKALEPRETFNTPSGKIELYATLFEEKGFDPLPTWRPKLEEKSDKYPFYLVINRPNVHKMHRTQNNPIADEISPENYAVMNAQVAQKMGIKDGEEVIVESKISEIKLKAKLIEGIRPDTIMIEHGFGRWAKGLKVAHGKGANDGDLIPDFSVEEFRKLNDPGAGACMSEVCLNVRKA